MITIDLITRYLKHRRKGHWPTTALVLSRQELDGYDHRVDLEEVGRGAFNYHYEPDDLPDGVTVLVELEVDDDADISYLGEFTDHDVDGERDIVDGFVNHHRREGTSRDLSAFEPMNTYADQRKWYRNNGYSKHESDCRAKASCLEDYRRAESYGRDWCSWHFVVTLEVDGREWRSDSCGGIDADDPEGYPLEMAVESARGLLDSYIEHEFAAVPQL